MCDLVWSGRLCASGIRPQRAECPRIQISQRALGRGIQLSFPLMRLVAAEDELSKRDRPRKPFELELFKRALNGHVRGGPIERGSVEIDKRSDGVKVERAVKEVFQTDRPTYPPAPTTCSRGRGDRDRRHAAHPQEGRRSMGSRVDGSDLHRVCGSSLSQFWASFQASAGGLVASDRRSTNCRFQAARVARGMTWIPVRRV